MKLSVEIETNRDMLKRIVALLLSLANLADCASLKSRRVRCQTLCYLRQAGIVGWGFALEEAYRLSVPDDLLVEAFDQGDSPDDARRLAVILRMLALTLAMRLALHRNPGNAPDSEHARCHPRFRDGRPQHNAAGFLTSNGPAPVCPQLIPP